MRPLLVIGVLALLAAGCGDGDDTTTDTGAAGAPDAHDEAVEPGLTAGEFIDSSIPRQAQEVQELVETSTDCAKVDAEPGGPFQVGVAITAAQSRPSTPLAEIVILKCRGG
jgi:hypothetical protein